MANSPNETTNENDMLLAQIRECFGRVAYSQKTHEKQADALLKKDRRWKVAQIWLSVLASGSMIAALKDLCGHEKFYTFFGAALATLLAGININFKNFSYGVEAERHTEVAARLWNVRESYFSLIADLMSNTISIEEGRKIRSKLQSELLSIYKNAPRTTGDAYLVAQEALKNNEELTFSTDELDKFLPEKMRLKIEGESE